MTPDTPPRRRTDDSSAVSTLRKEVSDTLRDRETLDLPVPSSRTGGPLPVEQHAYVTRYVARRVLGVGGMGEVRLCSDLRIGREVALKVKREVDKGGDDRFLREARLQGQLEHPAIVPVYDVGAAQEGPWFTMKRVRGSTLADVLESDQAEKLGVRKLLAAFVQVANAVAYAHARGVVHRDLKPSNVMLGDYGEVYVLDWGVAKVLGEGDVAIESDDVPTKGTDKTQMGTIVGTPGYMAPEQALGRIDQIDARTDVYALGAMLFEILALEPLHPLHTAEAAITSTVGGEVEARPSVRAPRRNAPPELDAVCVKATKLVPAERFESARELAAAVERFLDGDRDLALRRQLSEEQLGAAKAAADRGARIRALNRAVALDPSNESALRALTETILEPTTELPVAAEAELARADEDERRTTARMGTIAFLSWVLLSPLLFLPGLRSFSGWLGAVLVTCVSMLVSAWIWLRKKRPDDAAAFALLGLSTLAIAFASGFLGPFVLVPGWACQNTLVFAMHAPAGNKRWATMSIGALAIVVPFALELAGVLPPSFAFQNGQLIILPRLIDLPKAATLFLLVVGNVAMVFVPSLIVARVRDQALDAQRRLATHLAHLKNLVPDRPACR